MIPDIFTKVYLQSLNNQYDPPYNEQQMRQNGYDQETIQRLKRDPVHAWRMQTGIELIHRQPTKEQLERIWKNWQLMTPQQKTKSNQKCMQLFGVTNQFLYGYLIPQYRADASGEKCDVQYPPIPLNQYVKENIKDGKVYCCRPRLYERLEGSYTSQWSGEKGNIFVTPFKGIASCFVISKNSILRKFEKLGIRVQNCNFKYDVWNLPNEQLLDVKDTVKVTIERSGIVSDKVICGIAVGYLYTIDYQKYKDHCHMFNKNINSDVEFCIQGDVDYQSVQQITVKWTCNIQN